MSKRKPKSHRTGETALNEQGQLTYEYSDGAWRYENGSLASPHPRAMGHWTSEQATTIQNERHQKVREARDRALIEAAVHLKPELGSMATVEDAAALITKAQFELATSPDWAGASTGAAKYLDKTADFIPESTKETGNTLTITMTDATAIATLSKLADKASGTSD